MGETPQETDITVEFDCQFRVRLSDCRLTTLLAAFCTLLPKILTDFLQKALIGYGELVMSRSKKPFRCAKCGNDQEFIWKTRHGKETKVLTTFQWVVLQQLKVQCKRCAHKFYITRSLLGLERGMRIPKEVFRKLGLIGSLTTYRVAAKIVKTFGWTIDKMTIWKAVQKTAEEISFSLDPKEEGRGEADGTGIGINDIKKRGKELKVFIQYKKGGGVRVAGVDIGPYNGSWNKLFKPSLEAFKTFKNFLLLTDGDTSDPGRPERQGHHPLPALSLAYSPSAEVRPLERQETGTTQKQGLAVYSERGSGDLCDPLRGGGGRGHPGNDRFENETIGEGGCLLPEERVQGDGGLSPECQGGSFYRPFKPPPGKDDQQSGTVIPNREHEDQCREMEHQRRAQYHESQAGLLLQRI